VKRVVKSLKLQGPAPRAAGQALAALVEGNERFISGRCQHPHQDAARRSEVLAGQAPIAVIITCSDSRVPPEIVFDQGIGDLFVVRTAGNVLDDVALGSVEYAVEHLYAPLVLVMGHQKCGAVSAVMQGGDLTGHLAAIARQIEPALAQAKKMTGDLLANAIDTNIHNVVALLRTNEPVLKAFASTGALQIVGARYDLDSGQVTFFPA
jgi:carbonic anhydrase